MMDKNEWLSKIVDTISRLASRKYQAAAWFGQGDSVSSPDELYNELFDDLTFRTFFDKYSSELSDAQKSAWIELDNKLESYAKAMPNRMNPAAVMDDARWEQIRKSADNFLQLFNEGPKN
jgi:hypothetical protein